MKPRHLITAVALGALLLVLSNAAGAALVNGSDASTLAATRGCNLCHEARAPEAVGPQVPPIGPTWTDIARRYRGRADAVYVLTAAILAGSGGDEAKRHYAGRTSGVEMPPHLVEVSETDARRLAAWILTFDR